MADWVNIDGLAEWRGESVATIRRKLPSLYALGFPEPVLGKWYLPACQKWAEGVYFASEPRRDDTDPLMEALDG